MQRARPHRAPPARRSAPRLPRHGGRPVLAGRALPCGSGRLPPDFPQRLDRLKRASGLTWDQVAEVLGMETKQVLRWRKGAEPRGGPYHELVVFAGRVPGGLAILFGEDFPGAGG